MLARTNFFPVTLFQIFKFSLRAFFHFINNGGAGDRALFCHLTSSPQTQQQQADRDAP